jgi:glycine cleavage system aminomethyltransferase T
VRQKEQGLQRSWPASSSTAAACRATTWRSSRRAAVGKVTSGTFSPSLERPIGWGTSRSSLAQNGAALEIKAGEARLPARVVPAVLQARLAPQT